MRPAWLAPLLGLLPGCLLLDSFSADYIVAGECSGRWSHRYGNQNGVAVGGIARDAQSNLYVVGAYSGTVTFQNDVTTISDSERDAFVAAFDNDGNAGLALVSNAAGTESATAVAANDTVVIFAGTYGPNFDGCPTPGDQGIFVTHATAGPGTLALKGTTCVSSVSADPEVTGVAIDKDGEARVVGSFKGTLGTAQATDARDGFVASFSLADPPVLSGAIEVIGGPGDQHIQAVAARESGFVVAGSFADGTEAEPTPLGSDAFVALYSGATQDKLYRWGTNGDQDALSVAAFGGHIFVVGELDDGKVELGAGRTVSAPAGEDVAAYLVMLPDLGTSLGDPVWATGFSASDLDIAAVGVTNAAVYVGGSADGSLFIGGAEVGGRDVDLFVARFDRASGAHASTSRCGDVAAQRLIGLTTDPVDDAVFFVAELTGAIDLGTLQKHVGGPKGDLLIGELAFR